MNEAPKVKFYFSDGFEAYSSLWYHYGRYAVSEGKTDTFSVEGGMLNFTIISLGWRVHLVVSHAAIMP